MSKDSTFSELRGTVSGLGNTYATKEALDTVDGKFAGYVKGTDFDDKLSKSTVLDSKFVKDDDLENTLDKKGYLVITELDKELTNLAENKESTFGKLTVTADDASNKATSALTTANDATGRISTLSGDVDKLSGKYTTLSGNYTTLSGKYTTLDNKVTNMPETVVGVMKDNPKSPYYIGNWQNKTDGKFLVVTSDNVSEHKDTLGTGIDNLLADKESKTRLHEIASNVSGLGSSVNTINSNVGTLQSNVSGLTSSLNTLSGKAVTVDNLGDKLQGNSKFTDLSNSVNNLSSTVVTKSSLTQDLYNKLTNTRPDNSTGQCSIDDANLKDLLTGVASGEEAFGRCK